MTTGIGAIDQLRSSEVDICVTRIQHAAACELRMTIENYETDRSVEPYLELDFAPDWNHARTIAALPGRSGYVVPAPGEEPDTRIVIEFPPIPPREIITKSVATYPVHCVTIRFLDLWQAWDGKPSVWYGRGLMWPGGEQFWCEQCSPYYDFASYSIHYGLYQRESASSKVSEPETGCRGRTIRYRGTWSGAPK